MLCKVHFRTTLEHGHCYAFSHQSSCLLCSRRCSCERMLRNVAVSCCPAGSLFKCHVPCIAGSFRSTFSSLVFCQAMPVGSFRVVWAKRLPRKPREPHAEPAAEPPNASRSRVRKAPPAGRKRGRSARGSNTPAELNPQPSGSSRSVAQGSSRAKRLVAGRTSAKLQAGTCVS